MRRLWLTVDWQAPAESLAILDAYLHSVRDGDAVQLAVASGAMPEAEAGERLVALLGALPRFASTPRLPDITVFAGDVPEGAEHAAVEPLHRLREQLATVAAVTPVLDRADWARAWRPEPGVHHIAVDNRSTDGTAELLRAAGADVVVQPRRVERVANWAAAVDAFRERCELPWMKWQFAGDELAPGAAELIESASAAHPQARLLCAAFDVRHPDGRVQTVRPLPATRLLSPAQALALSATSGNWFGGPVATAVHRDAIDDVEFGALPWAADWQSCIAVARRHPVLYVAESIGTFDVSSRHYYLEHHAGVSAAVQDVAMRQQCIDLLRAMASPAEVAGVERSAYAVATAMLNDRLGRRTGEIEALLAA